VTRAPLIGLPACIQATPDVTWHAVKEQYIRGVLAAGGVPVLLPAIGPAVDIAELLRRLDGILLPGSSSNVEPAHYEGPPSRPGTLHDVKRDTTTLPLVRAALAAGLPLLAICRGHQELNVALGGTLHQNVHELPGKRDHRAAPGPSNEIRYAPAHPVRLSGWLADLAGATDSKVNSLHAQAIDRVAPGLVVEAVAPDDVIEAVRVDGATAFALGVQWHPEWSIATDRLSEAIFARFGAATRDHAARK
jgi:putative glutamine amidotransferase